jgi:hypothetical protein
MRMGIRIVLAVLGVVGWAIAIWAQIGDGVVLSLSSAIQLASALPVGQLDPGVLRLLVLNTQIWNVVLWMGIAVFALSCMGFWVLRKRQSWKA